MVSNNFSYTYPFLHILGLKVKPSFLILLVFLFLPLSHWDGWGKNVSGESAPKSGKKPKFTYTFHMPSTLWAEKTGRRTVITLLGIYILFFLLYWLQPSMGIPDGDALWLISLAEGFLQYETVLSILLLLFTAGVVAIQSNKHQYLQTLDHIVNIFLLFCVGCTQIAQQIPPDWSFANLTILFFISVGLETCQVQTITCNHDTRGGFLPVTSYLHLFLPRKRQADQLMDLIQNSSPQPLSICISGDWGSGKTSLVNGTLEKLLREFPHQYEVIRINALELDTLQSLKSYVFTQIRRCLKSRGIYVGIGSEYQKFLTAVAGSISTPSLANLLAFHLFPPAHDYREERQRLETVLVDTLGEQGRIIIVVDDIERCGEKKAQEFLFFIKEIATMSHCVTLFLSDEKQLHAASQQITGSDHDENSDYIFYEKFFNYRIEVVNVQPYSVMQEYEGGKFVWSKLSHNLKSPAELYHFFDQQLLKKREAQEQKASTAYTKSDENANRCTQKLEHLQELHAQFRDYLSNPRHLVKLYHTLERYSNDLIQKFAPAPAEVNQPELDAYFGKLKLDELLFYLAYLEVCFPAEAKMLKSRGRTYFEGFVPEEHPAILTELGENFLFEQSVFANSSVHFNYLQNERLTFIDVFYLDNSQLPNLVSQFTTQEEAWFNALDKGQAASLEAVWDQVLNAVLRKFAFRSISDPEDEASRKLETGQGYIKQLFQLAAEHLQSKQWTPDRVLSFMDHLNHNEHFLSQDLAVMRDFWDICGKYFHEPSQQLCSRLRIFSVEYIQNRMQPITSLLHYVVASEEEGRTKDLALLKKISDSLFIELPVQQRLNIYTSSLSALTFPLDCGGQDDAFAQLDRLADDLEAQLTKNDLLRFDDVKQTLERMRMSIQDMCYFSKLLIQLEPTDPISLFDASSLEGSQVYEALMRFQPLFLERPLEYDEEADRRFNKLFDRIQSDPSVCLMPKQIEDLQQLVTIYYKQIQRSPLFYRKALIDYQQRQTLSAKFSCEQTGADV